MLAVGIDLAGSEKNNTGLCAISVSGGDKVAKTMVLKGDGEIQLQCALLNPDVIAIDAPLTPARNGVMRASDRELQEYGALPHNLPGMARLVERGIALANSLRSDYRVIEVFSTATAKILGFYHRSDIEMQKSLSHLVRGLTDRILTRDELDSISAAITGLLYLEGRTIDVGDEEGRITIPRV